MATGLTGRAGSPRFEPLASSVVRMQSGLHSWHCGRDSWLSTVFRGYRGECKPLRLKAELCTVQGGKTSNSFSITGVCLAFYFKRVNLFSGAIHGFRSGQFCSEASSGHIALHRLHQIIEIIDGSSPVVGAAEVSGKLALQTNSQYKGA